MFRRSKTSCIIKTIFQRLAHLLQLDHSCCPLSTGGIGATMHCRLASNTWSMELVYFRLHTLKIFILYVPIKSWIIIPSDALQTYQALAIPTCSNQRQLSNFTTHDAEKTGRNYSVAASTKLIRVAQLETIDWQYHFIFCQKQSKKKIYRTVNTAQYIPV